ADQHRPEACRLDTVFLPDFCGVVLEALQQGWQAARQAAIDAILVDHDVSLPLLKFSGLALPTLAKRQSWTLRLGMVIPNPIPALRGALRARIARRLTRLQRSDNNSPIAPTPRVAPPHAAGQNSPPSTAALE